MPNNSLSGRPEVPGFPVKFTSRLTRRELVCILLWIPMHLYVLPRIAGGLMEAGKLTEAQANMLIYCTGSLYMLLAAFSFLRREFDPLCDRPFYCVLQIISCYLTMLALNMCASGLVSLFDGVIGSGSDTLNNLNNGAIVELASEDYSVISAMSIFLAPIVEELIFRAGIFNGIRNGSVPVAADGAVDSGSTMDDTNNDDGGGALGNTYSKVSGNECDSSGSSEEANTLAVKSVNRRRLLAYAVSILVFALYHVWSYALYDPTYWLYLLQYIPAGFVLCRCYERTNSVWCCIFLHMLTNGIALEALSALEGML